MAAGRGTSRVARPRRRRRGRSPPPRARVEMQRAGENPDAREPNHDRRASSHHARVSGRRHTTSSTERNSCFGQLSRAPLSYPRSLMASRKHSCASSGDHHLPRRSPPRARAERPTVLPGRSVEPSVEPQGDRRRRKGRGRMGTHRRTPRRTRPGPSGTGCRARGAASEHLRSRSLWPCVVGTCKKLRESTWCDCIRIREVKRNPKGEPAFLPEKGCIELLHRLYFVYGSRR